MDVFSGNIPRKFIPLRLEILDEEESTPGAKQPLPPIESAFSANSNAQGASSSNPATPSTGTSTGEDVNEYASRVVTSLESKLQESSSAPGVTFLDSPQLQNKTPSIPPASKVQDSAEQHTDKPPVTKTSTEVEESDENISEVSDFPHLDSVVHNSVPTTDISDGEGGVNVPLYGVGGSTCSSILGAPKRPAPRAGLHIERGYSEDEADEYRNTVLTPNREMCASARTLVKKNFADNDRFNLPVGHPAVVFSESQMYGMLRAISDESVHSSFKLTKNLVLETRGLRIPSPSRFDQRTASFRKPKTPLPSVSGESAQDSDPNEEQQLSEAESSGALHSGDDTSSVPFIREAVETDLRGFLLPGDCSGSQSNRPPDTSPFSPGGTSTSSNQPLSLLKSRLSVEPQDSHNLPSSSMEVIPEEPPKDPVKAPPRRAPKKLQVLKSTYSVGMSWTRTFVCGPKDPLNNKHSFYCRLCKTNLSCKTKGALEVLRHHKSDKHLRRDQRWRYEHLKTVDPVTGNPHYEVRDKHGRVLDPYQLQKELPNFIDTPLVDLGPKFPFYEEVEGTIGGEATDEDRQTLVQLTLVANFIGSCGDLHMLQNLWTNVGVAAGTQPTYTDLNWDKNRTLVSSFTTSYPVILF